MLVKLKTLPRPPSLELVITVRRGHTLGMIRWNLVPAIPSPSFTCDCVTLTLPCPAFPSFRPHPLHPALFSRPSACRPPGGRTQGRAHEHEHGDSLTHKYIICAVQKTPLEHADPVACLGMECTFVTSVNAFMGGAGVPNTQPPEVFGRGRHNIIVKLKDNAAAWVVPKGSNVHENLLTLHSVVRFLHPSCQALPRVL